MKMKRVLRGTLAVSLSFLLATQALAAVVEHDISTGDLTISQENVNADGYRVTGGTDEYTITVEDGVETEIELDNVSIHVEDKSAIDIQGDADVTLNLTGSNIAASYTEAAIHVIEGSLTITSDSEGYLWADNDWGYGTESAAIGSNEGEDFSGSITIGGNAVVDATSDNDGTAIGSGQGEWVEEYDEFFDELVEYAIGGNMDGTITIQDDAVVYAYSDDDGAGIGSGLYGDMSGTIIIKDNAQVKAASEEDGAGIGSGDSGDVSGTITIEGSAQVTAEADETGAGIGSGEGGEMSGTITIGGDANVEAKSGKSGAGIGSGAAEEYGRYDENGNWVVEGYEGGSMNGTITIGDNAQVTALSEEDGAGIGSGLGGSMGGSIAIGDNARIDAESSGNGAGIGAGQSGEIIYNDENGEWISTVYFGGDVSGTITIDGNADVDASSEKDGAGIGSGAGGGGVDGDITIGGSAYVYAEGGFGSGAGIGSGYLGDMDGTIAIGEDAQVMAVGGEFNETDGGAGIGAGNWGYMSGTIALNGNAVVSAYGFGGSAGIGGGTQSDITGDISITGNAEVWGGGMIGPGANGDNNVIATYTIGGNTIINGVSGSNTAALQEYLDLETANGGKVQMTVEAQTVELTPTYTMRNEARDIQVTVRDDMPRKLLESAIDDEALALLSEGVAEENILRTCHLEFDRKYSDAIVLTFSLKGENLGKRVEIRWLEDGEVVRRTVPVNEDGEARVILRQLGDFIVVAK